MSARQHTHGLITGIPKDYRRVVRTALAQGRTLQQTGKGHPKPTAPDGSWATPIPSSSNNSSLFKAIVARLQKHGLDVAT